MPGAEDSYDKFLLNNYNLCNKILPNVIKTSRALSKITKKELWKIFSFIEGKNKIDREEINQIIDPNRLVSKKFPQKFSGIFEEDMLILYKISQKSKYIPTIYLINKKFNLLKSLWIDYKGTYLIIKKKQKYLYNPGIIKSMDNESYMKGDLVSLFLDESYNASGAFGLCIMLDDYNSKANYNEKGKVAIIISLLGDNLWNVISNKIPKDELK